MSFDDLYVHEKGSIKEWSPGSMGKASCSMFRGTIGIILRLFFVAAVSIFIFFTFTNATIKDISTTVDINPLAEQWLPKNINTFTVGTILAVVAFVVGLAFYLSGRERAAYMVVFVGMLVFFACVFYYLFADAIEATSVLFTSPGDPYYIRYHVGTELVREIGAPDLYNYWIPAIASIVALIVISVYMFSAFSMNKRFDIAASKKTFPVKQSKTTEFTCTSIDGKDICKLK